MHTFPLGLVKLFVNFYVKMYKGAGFRALKSEDARQQFLGLPSEYGRGLKPVFPQGIVPTRFTLSYSVCQSLSP